MPNDTRIAVDLAKSGSPAVSDYGRILLPMQRSITC
jgi:hypothetical protein